MFMYISAPSYFVYLFIRRLYSYSVASVKEIVILAALAIAYIGLNMHLFYPFESKWCSCMYFSFTKFNLENLKGMLIKAELKTTKKCV